MIVVVVSAHFLIYCVVLFLAAGVVIFNFCALLGYVLYLSSGY